MFFALSAFRINLILFELTRRTDRSNYESINHGVYHWTNRIKEMKIVGIVERKTSISTGYNITVNEKIIDDQIRYDL